MPSRPASAPRWRCEPRKSPNCKVCLICFFEEHFASASGSDLQIGHAPRTPPQVVGQKGHLPLFAVDLDQREECGASIPEPVFFSGCSGTITSSRNIFASLDGGILRTTS